MKRKTQIAVIIISILCLLVGTSVLADEQISGFLQSHNIVSSVNSIAEKITSKPEKKSLQVASNTDEPVSNSLEIDDSSKCGDNVSWSYDSTTNTLTISGTGAMYDYRYNNETPWNVYCEKILTVKIESGVTTIGKSAFSYFNNLTSATIPNSVTIIGERAFSGCSSLTSVTIPDSVMTIGDSAFSNCSSLTNVTIPNSVTTIGDLSFNYCTGLISITIPNGVTQIGRAVFQSCRSLKIIEIPDSVISIGECAFSDCRSLTSITIPNSVTTLGAYVFQSCRSLTSVEFPNSVTSIGEFAFSYCSGLTSVTIPNSVTSIGNGVFQACDSLTSVEFPDSITTIGGKAFFCCTNLTSMTIPNSVTSIGDCAFGSCSSLTSVTIPNSVTSIGNSAFDNCSSLKDVYYSGSEEQWKKISIGNYANDYLLNATIHYSAMCAHTYSAVVVEPTCTTQGYTEYTCTKCGESYTADYVDAIGHRFDSNNDYCLNGCGTLNPDAVKTGKCGDNVSWSYNPTTNTLTISGTGAMYDFEQNLHIPIDPDEISLSEYSVSQASYTEESAPWYRFDIFNVIIESGVTHIGENAFKNYSVQKITISNSVKTIGNSAFSGCSGLETVCYMGSESEWNLISIGSNNNDLLNANRYYKNGKCGDNVYWSYDEDSKTLTISGTGAMNNYEENNKAPWYGYCENILTVKIESGVTTIGSCAFEDCSSLTSVTIPNSVTTIGEEALCFCSSLTSITIPDSVTIIGDYVFDSCSSLTNINVALGNLNYSSKDGVLFDKNKSTLIQYPIGNQRTEYIIPNSVTTIGEFAFDECSSLTSVTIPNSVTSIGGWAFSNCDSLTSATIPNSVTSIGERAFSFCSSLTSVTIPDSVTIIGESAFSGCSSLTNINVASGNLNYSSKDGVLFDKNKSNLIQYPEGNQRTEYTVPNSVTTIESWAFYDCDSLTSVTIPNSVTTIGNSAFESCSSLISVTIPNSVKTIGAYVFQYCERLTSVEIPNSVTTIEGSAFEFCSSLTSVTIPNSVTTIGEGAFYDCSSLTSVEIPDSVTTIERSAFGYCSGLKDVYYLGSEEQWKAISIGSENDYLLNAEIHYNSAMCDHTYSAVVVEPTCTTQGYTEYTCTKCGESYTADYVDAFGHDEVVDIAVEPTCTETGLTEGKHCSRCNEVLVNQETVPALGHDEVVDIAVEPTCTETGLTEGKHCSRCNEVLVNQETVPALGHNEVVDKAVAPTCTKTGLTQGKHCSRCNEVLVKQEVVEALGHNEVVDKAVAPTCTKTGLTQGKHCSRCNEVLVKQEIVPALGHNYNDDNDYCLNNCGTPNPYLKKGECGVNVKWRYSSLTNSLKITGSGTINDYNTFKKAPWYEFRHELATVEIAEGITTVGANAFSGCYSLKTVSVPSSVKAIGDKAFYQCNGLQNIAVAESNAYYSSQDGVLFDKNKETLIQYPVDNDRSSYTLPSSVKSIGDYAFAVYERGYWRFNLKNVEITEGVVSIGRNAFYGQHLESVSIPKSVKTIEKYAFANRDNSLKDVYYGSSLYKWNKISIGSSNGALDKAVKHYKYSVDTCEHIYELVMNTEPTCSEAGARVFECNKCGYDYTEILEALGHIEVVDKAVAPTCTETGLTEGKHCSRCNEVLVKQEVIDALGHRFDSKNDHCLNGCGTLNSNIKTGICGDNVRWSYEIDSKTLIIYGTGDIYDYEHNLGAVEEFSLSEASISPMASYTDQSNPWSSLDIINVVIESGVTRIGEKAFKNCNIKNISIPDSVVTIGNFAFDRCSSLTSINVASGNLNYSSKYGVLFDKNKSTLIHYPIGNQRTEYTVPNSVKTIGARAFYGCSSLTNVTIPNSVTTIEGYAFDGCKNLTSVEIPDSITTIGAGAFYGCSSLTSVEIPDSVTTIGDYAFYSCSSLTSVTIPNSVTTIGELAFYDCRSLISVTIPNSVTTIERGAFNGCKSLTNITIPNSVTIIGELAFCDCGSLTSVEIPDSVTTIGDNAFYLCSSLTNIEVASGNLNYSSKNGVLFDKNKSKLIQYPAGNQRTEYTIPNSVKTVERSAFFHCSSLTSVTIGNSVTTIGGYAFFSCSSLTSVTIGNSVTTIEWSAFDSCSGLKDVYYSGSEKQWKKISIGIYNDNLLNATIHYNSAICEHTYSAVVVAPTCIKQGYTQYTCTNCGESYIADYVDALGHVEVVDKAVAPTCTKSGLTEGKHCSRCNASIVVQKTIDALGHSYGEWQILKEATILNEGERQRSCKACNHTVKEKIQRVQVDLETSEEYGMANFTVVNAQTKKPMKNACVFIKTENDGENTFITDENGKVSTVLPVGTQTISAYAEGCLVRSLKINIKTGQNDVPLIGLSDKPTYDASIKHHEMTKEEIKDAGIDTSATDNNHVYKYELRLDFEPEVDTESIVVYFDGDGKYLGGQRTEPQKETKPDSGLLHYQVAFECDEHCYSCRYNCDHHITVKKGQTVTLDYQPDPIDTFNGVEYTFSGWYADSSCTKKISTKYIEDNSSVNVYGKWTYKCNHDHTPTDIDREIKVRDDLTIVPVSEYFYMIIRGETKWLKEMFDVEMLILNNSTTDTMENVSATLDLPKGLSLATMSGEQQTLTKNVGHIEEGGQRKLNWYIRGDEAGKYSISTSLKGKIMPFEESIDRTYKSSDLLQVMAGNAMHLDFEFPNATYYNDDYPVRITLTNVSNKPLYNVNHMVQIEQGMEIYYNNGGENKKVKKSQWESIGVEQFNPGDKIIIEASVNVFFKSEIIEQQLKRYIGMVDDMENIINMYKAAKFIYSLAGDFKNAIDGCLNGIDLFVNSAGMASDRIALAKELKKSIVDFTLKYSKSENDVIDAIIKTSSSSVGMQLDILSKNPEEWLSTASISDIKTLIESINSLSNSLENGLNETDNQKVNLFDSLRTFISAIPVKFVLNSVVMTEDASNTTQIPWSYKTYNTNAHYMSVSEMNTYLSNIYKLFVSEAYDQVVPSVFQIFPGLKNPVDDKQVSKEIIATENKIKEFQAKSATGDVTFKAYVVSNGQVDNNKNFDVSCKDNDSAVSKDGVVSFDGNGTITVVPNNSNGGTLVIEDSEGNVTKYNVNVVKPHTCEPTEQKVLIPPTENRNGVLVKYCGICGNLMEAEIISATKCNHKFGEWKTETNASCQTEGVRSHECSVCGCVETEFIEKIPHKFHTTVITEPTCTTVGKAEVVCEICNQKEIKEIPTIDHTYSAVVVAPTCTTQGYTEFTCTKCNTVYKSDYVEALGHIEVVDSAVAPTCTETGLTEGKHCSRCNEILVNQNVVEATGHRFENGNAFCLNNCGTLNPDFEIGDCGENVKWRYDSKTKELTIFGSGNMEDYRSSSQSPWCDISEEILTVKVEKGVTSVGSSAFEDCYNLQKVELCDGIISLGDSAFCYCENLTSITIPNSVTSIGNNIFRDCSSLVNVDIPENVESIGSSAFYGCTELTRIELSRKLASIENHTFHNCTKLISVSIPVSVKAVGSYAFMNCNGLKYVFYSGSESDWSEMVIGKRNEPLTNAEINYNSFTCEHTFDEGRVLKSATCTDEGESEFTCTRCGFKQTVVNPALGHDYKLNVIAPTCTEDGFTIYTCARCNNEYKSDYTNALGHNPVIDKAVASNCTETGLTQGKHCSRCNEVLVKQEIVPALGHNEVIDKAVAPTCTETGLTQGKHCSRCNEVLVKQEVVEALGHNEVVDKAVAPTCTETGLTQGKHCSRCNTVLVKQETVNALGHDEVVDKAVASTCTETGLTQGKHCSRCNEVLVRQIAVKPLGHIEVVDKAVAPTCTETGLTQGKHCSRCNEVLVNQETVPALGHNYNNDNDYCLNNCGTPNPYLEKGECGVNVQWKYSSLTKSLKITGSGAMADYRSSSKSPWYDISEGILTVKVEKGVTSVGSSAFEDCYNLQKVELCDGIISLGDSAFCYCENLTSITIPNSVTSIGNNVFRDCGSLANVKISENVESIGSSAFYGCIKLAKIELPSNLSSIENHTFHNCTNLISVSIPVSVKSVGSYAFDECQNLKYVYYSGSESNWAEIVIGKRNEPLINAQISFLGEYCELEMADVKADMLGAINFLKNEKDYNGNFVTRQTVENSYTVHAVAQAGGDVSEYLTALESNLKANNGKIMARQAKETEDSENLVYYAVAIDVLTILGKDVTNFGGYNVKQAFETFAQTNKNVSNPYFYRCIVEACKAIGNDELAKTLIDQMSKNYTVGSGFDYWGYSCDNTAIYVATIAPYKDYYQNNYNDALKLIAKYKKAKGYYSDDKYTTTENADSTAYAMMAYSAAGDFDKAYEAYQLLKNFESKNNNGVFMAADWKTGAMTENQLATADALRALSYFNSMKVHHSYNENGVCSICGSKKDNTINSEPKSAYDCASSKELETTEAA
ncbi:leucine-rich repeat protein [uncultured Eubacterium sp.]|uniref:leucine-rich repeat protein n=1 Tax=uncultured Eubacterium sp. TaxID=165185 RepID=UPI00258F88C5|nr:leucine-rich repeat protein [uncultured Eubacterium sp.]